MHVRALASLGALITWAGLGLQLFILMTGPLGPLGGAWRFIAFFTVLMNLLAAGLFTRVAIAPRFSPATARLQTASAVYMAVVGGSYSERSYGRFERRIGLPQGVDRDKAAATFRNGVLTVTLPRTEAANENVRRIPVNGKAA